MTTFNISKALQDPTRYLDVFPMKWDHNEDYMHIDHFSHGTGPDMYDFMVRSETLTEDDIYCEIEDVPPKHYLAVEAALTEMYNL